MRLRWIGPLQHSQQEYNKLQKKKSVQIKANDHGFPETTPDILSNAGTSYFPTWFLTNHLNFTPLYISVFQPCWVWSHYSPYHRRCKLLQPFWKARAHKTVKLFTLNAPQKQISITRKKKSTNKGEMHKEQIKKRNTYMFVARLFIMAHNQGTVLELGGWLLSNELGFLLWHKVDFKKQKRER